MKWIIEIFLVVAALAIEMTLEPTPTLSFVLFGIAGVAALALAIGFLWRSERVWKIIALKLMPHLAATGNSELDVSKPTGKELASAVDDLLDELNTIDGYLGTALATKLYGKSFHLPAEIYHRYKGLISERDKEARSALGQVYVDADQLNNFLYRRGPGEVGRDGEPVNPEKLRAKISTARDQLVSLRPG